MSDLDPMQRFYLRQAGRAPGPPIDCSPASRRVGSALTTARIIRGSVVAFVILASWPVVYGIVEVFSGPSCEYHDGITTCSSGSTSAEMAVVLTCVVGVGTAAWRTTAWFEYPRPERIDPAARAWFFTGFSIAAAGFGIPIALIATMYRGCAGDCGGGLFVMTGGAFLIGVGAVLASAALFRLRSLRPPPEMSVLGWVVGLLSLPLLIWSALGVVDAVDDFGLALFWFLTSGIPGVAGLVTFFGVLSLRRASS